MRVTRIKLNDFRNYEQLELRLKPGFNIFVGKNGQGKTNLVEAIAYFAVLGSHRVTTDAPLVRSGADFAFMKADFAHEERQIQLDLQLNRQGTNRAWVNQNPVRVSELPRYAQVILFAPEDLQIVRGEPGARRRFVDHLLIQRMPRMAGVIADYEKVLRQRNTLLKSFRGKAGQDIGTLEVWDEKLVQLGSTIIQGRLRLFEDLKPYLQEAYSGLVDESHHLSGYWVLSLADAATRSDRLKQNIFNDELLTNPEKIAEFFREALAANRSQELERGMTLVGPHRDDLILELRDLSAKSHASHGESWSVALSLRLASARLLRADSFGGDPIVILDDVFAELDASRRQRLSEVVRDFEQVLVTVAVENDIPLDVPAHRVEISAGEVLGVSDV